MVPDVGIGGFIWQARWLVISYNVTAEGASDFLRLQRSNVVKSFVLCHSPCRLPFHYLLLNFFMPERIQKPVEPAPWGPKEGDGGGPRSPDVSRPDTKDLLKKMRKVDPNQSKRYRQRTGQ
jgi:ubiquitin-like protein UBact